MKRKVIISFVSLAVFVAGFFMLQRLLVPKYVTENKEGALIREYYDNAGGNDIIFIGDCEVYESFSPMRLWEKYGITSYVRGSANQTIWQSYYILKETLKYETPKVVVFNVLSMKYDKPVKEEYNRLTLDGMKLSLEKMQSVSASMTEEENAVSYIFPILRFHYRYSELTKEDIKYYITRPQVSYMGYLMNKNVKPYTVLPSRQALADYTFADVCYDYLERITKLCRENNIELILVKAPSLYPYWYDEWDNAMEEYAKNNGLFYINFLECVDETGIDYSTDTYDGGLHLNLYGAEKLTDYFGRMLISDLNIEFSQKSDTISRKWNERLEEYAEERMR